MGHAELSAKRNSLRVPDTRGRRLLDDLRQATLDQRFAGWYLFATHYRWWTDDSLAVDYAARFPKEFAAAGAIDGLSATSPAAGPVCCVPAAPTISAPVRPAAPTAEIRSRARRSKSRLVVGAVTCAQRCVVGLSVRGGHRATIRRSFTAAPGQTSLTVPLRRGRLSVRVAVDGKLVAAGATVAR